MQASKPDSKREAILMLGMHRSGTSALAGMLVKLGAEPGRTLMQPSASNPKGYWESVALMRFHDQLLASSGSTWQDWEAFNPDWIDSSTAGQFAEQLPPLLEQEFGDARMMLIKDPRICRFVPFWLATLRDLAIVPRIVIPVRDPLEVAASLARRNQLPQGEALLIWLRHVLDVEHATRGMERAFVFYEDVLADWRGVAHRLSVDLGIKWPRWSSTVELEVDDLLTPELKHNRAADVPNTSGAGMEHWVGTVHQALRVLASGEAAQGQQKHLDAIRGELDRLGDVFGTRLREQERRLAEQVHDLERMATDMELARQEREAVADALGEARASLGAVSEQLRQSQSAYALLSDRNAALEAVSQGLKEEIRAVKAGRDGEVARYDISQQKLAFARRELAGLRGSQEARLEADARLSFVLQEREELAARLAGMLSREYWRQVEQDRRARPWWRRAARRLLGHQVQDAEQAELRMLEASPLFDGGFYLREYPDVAQAEMSPAVHYVRHGHAEGRNPGPNFDGTWYINRHPDVAAGGFAPLLHYEQFGRAEGRATRAVRTESRHPEAG